VGETRGFVSGSRETYKNLTAPIKFKAQKLAAKFSKKCQVRCKDFAVEGRKQVSDGPSTSKLYAPACSRVVADGGEKGRERQRFLSLPHPPKRAGGGGKGKCDTGGFPTQV
jgi:hypothetical protein